MFASAIFSGLLASVGAAYRARSPDVEIEVSEMESPRQIEALADGETYREIPSQDRQTVKESLDRISGLLGDAQNADQLPEATRVEVFNEQERVNTLLTKAREDSRLVCTREKKVGSHRTTNSCKTVAERRRDMEESQNALRRNMRARLRPSLIFAWLMPCTTATT